MKVKTHPRYSCVILDDDLSMIFLMEKYLANVDKMYIAGSFFDPIRAMAAFQKYELIDFLFIDIQMDVSGLDLARMLKFKVKYVVFITSHPQYALRAFHLGDAYLVKPFGFPEFLNVVNGLIAKNRLRNPIKEEC